MEELKVQLFSRSAADVRAEINRLKEDVARHHLDELLWANHTVASPFPTVGASALVRTLWDTHRLKCLIRGLERDLRRIERQYSEAVHRLMG